MKLADLTSVLSVQWGLTDIMEKRRLQSYPTRTVYRVASEQGTFAVKIDAAPGPDFTGSDEVQDQAAQALPGHVAGIRRTRAGELSVLHRDCRVTVFEDIAGGHPPATPETWSGLGMVLAELHAVRAETRPFGVPVQAAASELERLAGNYSFATHFRSLAARVREIEPAPATAIVHGEVNLTNVLQRPDGELVLIDWDNAGAGPIALDLGYPLICVFLTEKLQWNATQATAFYDAYRAARTIAVPSPDQIFHAAIMHALRYLRFGDHDRRWRRITYALENEEALTRVADVR